MRQLEGEETEGRRMKPGARTDWAQSWGGVCRVQENEPTCGGGGRNEFGEYSD